MNTERLLYSIAVAWTISEYFWVLFSSSSALKIVKCWNEFSIRQWLILPLLSNWAARRQYCRWILTRMEWSLFYGCIFFSPVSLLVRVVSFYWWYHLNRSFRRVREIQFRNRTSCRSNSNFMWFEFGVRLFISPWYWSSADAATWDRTN